MCYYILVACRKIVTYAINSPTSPQFAASYWIINNRNIKSNGSGLGPGLGSPRDNNCLRTYLLMHSTGAGNWCSTYRCRPGPWVNAILVDGFMSFTSSAFNAIDYSNCDRRGHMNEHGDGILRWRVSAQMTSTTSRATHTCPHAP